MTTNKQIQKGFCIVIIVIILLIILDFATPTNTQNFTLKTFSYSNIDLNCLIHDCLSASIGIAFTLYFIELIINNARKKEEEDRRQKQIKNIMKVMKYPLENYKNAAVIITNETVGVKNTEMKLPVSMEALCSIFKDQSHPNKPVWYKKIELYSDAVDMLHGAITNIVLNINLSDNEDLIKLLTEYLYVMPNFNSCSSLIDMMSKRVEDKTLADLCVENLPTLGLEINSDNICYSFVQLKRLIEYHSNFIEKLEKIA